MGRLEKRHLIIRRRFRVFLALLLCTALFCAGLSIVDVSFKEMMGVRDHRPIFGVYGLQERLIRLEFAGSEVIIDKSEWQRAYATVKERLAKLVRK
jgi:hypothetical protein